MTSIKFNTKSKNKHLWYSGFIELPFSVPNLLKKIERGK